MTDFQLKSQAVLKELENLLNKISPDQLTAYVAELLAAEKIFFVGVGRVKLSLETAEKRFCHLGLDCHFVGEINEPPISSKDLLIVGSGSGESLFPLAIARKAKEIGARVVHLTSNHESSIAQLADVKVVFESPSKSSQKVSSIQPMTTIFEQGLFLLHDILTLELMDHLALTFDDLKNKHANLE